MADDKPSFGDRLMSAASWFIPGVLSAGGALQQQASSRTMAREQMAFQERMSSTAYQRSVQDLIKAGLNPALAYGHPASSPAGSMGQAQDIAGRGVSSAMAAKMNKANLDLLAEQQRKASSEADSAFWDSQMRANEFAKRQYLMQPDSKGRTPYFEAERARLMADIESAPLNVQALRTALTLSGQKVPVGQVKARLGEWFDRMLQMGGNITSSAKGAAEDYMMALPPRPITYKNLREK